jgi:hypothetical protein
MKIWLNICFVMAAYFIARVIVDLEDKQGVVLDGLIAGIWCASYEVERRALRRERPGKTPTDPPRRP